jgi:2-polyprenyl-3-methyl-5-hydroxy-6-metoxy-1,4-benzoquinol methylase
MSRAAASREFIVGYHDSVRRDAFHMVPHTEGTLLEIGGGAGGTSVALKQMGRARRIAVVDIVGKRLPEVDAGYAGDLNQAAFFEEIRAGEGQVQTILCLDVLEHLIDPWEVVRSLHGLLAPGGSIVASLPNMRYWKLSWNLFAHGEFELADDGIKDRTHLRWFVRKTAIELMTCSGLHLVEIEGRIAGKRPKVVNRLTFGIAQSLFEMQYFLRVARRD